MLRSSSFSPLRALSMVGLMAALLVVISGCKEKTPQEKVAEARAAYVVELNSWFPREPEPEPVEEMAAEGEVAEGEAAEAVAEGEAAEGEAAEGEAAEGEEVAIVDVDAEVGPRTVSIFFDLIVLFEGKEPLSGLTLDISQADASGAEKKTWRHYQELPSHIKGETKQVSFESPDIEFAEGDQFSVTLRKVVPAEEQGEYREFAAGQ